MTNNKIGRSFLALVLCFPLFQIRCFAVNPSDFVASALELMAAQYPRTLTTIVQTASGDVTQKWEIASSRRFHYVQTPIALSKELYVWEESAYLREPAGWYRKELNTYPIELGSLDLVRKGLTSTLSQVQRLPDSLLNGNKVKHYSALVDYKDEFGVYLGHFEIWLSITSSLPVRSTFSGSYGDTPLKINTEFDYVTVPHLAKPQPVVNPE